MARVRPWRRTIWRQLQCLRRGHVWVVTFVEFAQAEVPLAVLLCHRCLRGADDVRVLRLPMPGGPAVPSVEPLEHALRLIGAYTSGSYAGPGSMLEDAARDAPQAVLAHVAALAVRMAVEAGSEDPAAVLARLSLDLQLRGLGS
jgi:hypothetical protein